MKLRRLAIERLPGISERFELDAIGDGLQVVTGPNGIGKSSLCRAARALLWPEHAPAGYMSAHALFEIEDRRLRVERDGAARHRWQQDGVDTDRPLLPAAHLDGCYFPTLHDLLDPSADAGADLAHQIRLQMSGGFDIDAVADKLFGHTGPQHGRGARKALDEADKRLAQAVARQHQLSREQARLGELERELEQAVSAARRREYVAHAVEVVRQRDEHRRVQLELAALPAGCHALTGNELTELAQREAELDTKRTQKHNAEATLRAALDEAADTRLEEPLDASSFAAWRQRADALPALEMQIDDASAALAGQRRALTEARRTIGASEDRTGALDVADAADLFNFLRDASRLRIESTAVAERLRILEGVVFTDADRRRLDLLRDGAGALRAWLRAPDPASRNARVERRGALYTAAALLAVLGIALGWLVDPWFAAAAGAGLGIVAAAWWLKPGTEAAAGQQAAQRDYPAGLSPPRRWTAADAATRLREIEGDAAKLEGLAEHAGFAAADRAQLDDRRTDLERQLGDLQQRRQALASRLELEGIADDAELVDTARALDRLRAAAEAECQGAERLRQLTERHRLGLAALAVELTRYGEVEPADAAAARAALDSLDRRSKALVQARAQAATARGEIDRIDQDLEHITGIIAELYRQRGLEPGDRDGLVRLLAELERYRALSLEGNRHALAIEFAIDKLKTAGELELADRDAAWLADEQRRLDEQASRRDELRARISDIRADVRRARQGHDVEEAIAARDECRSQLEGRRGEALRCAAGRVLLDRVKQEHEANQMPRVLERTRELFASFTHHAYDLRVPPDTAGSFVAIEAGRDEGLRPDQLSGGTRVQLLLAARLAFATHAEGGLHLPLFLDEALDQSDPVRFRAIARSLGRIAADEDRQIFYLTSDPSDAARIQEALAAEGCKPAGVIDLAEVRQRGTSVPDSSALRIAPPPAVPDPAGMTPEAYGAALGIAALDPRRGQAAQHLFHLAWDDLSLLHALLSASIRTVGQWELLSRNAAPLAASIRADSTIGAQLDDRARLLEAFCRAWREGRGKPVTRETLEASGAITDRFLDGVAEVTAELNGDAERLMAILRAHGDDRLQRFRATAADDLQAYLTEHGFLDPRPILTEPDLTTRILMTPAAGRLPGAVVAECMHRWWRLSKEPSQKSFLEDHPMR